MESLFFLVPIALVFVAVALRILLWALNSGQYDNLDTEAHRILFDEDNNQTSPSPTTNPESSQEQRTPQNPNTPVTSSTVDKSGTAND